MSDFPSLDRRRRNRIIFLTVSAICATAIILVANEVLLPFVLGVVVAYILLPIVLRVERRGVPRWAAILLVYAVTLGAIGGFIAAVVPSLITEARALRRDLPRQIAQAEETWVPALDARLRGWTGTGEGQPDGAAPDGAGEDALERIEADSSPEKPEDKDKILVVRRDDGGYELKIGSDVEVRQRGEGVWRVDKVERDGAPSVRSLIQRGLARGSKYLSENSVELLKLGQRIVGAVSRAIFVLFMTLMLGGYMMLTHEKIIRFFRELFALETQPSFDRLLHRLDRGLSGVVRGQLLICAVNGILSAIGFWLFDLKYWPLMALIAAIGSLIPIFGSIVAAFPAVAIGLTQSFGTAFAVLVWIIGIHQLEANFLNPKIIGDSAKIHPVLVVFSLLVGEHFFQIKGALFAVPCMSILQTLFLHFRETTMGLKDPTATQNPTPLPAGGPPGIKSSPPSGPPPPVRDGPPDSVPPSSLPPASIPPPSVPPPKRGD
ncbi:MAG: AI-2E family transporter [Polyangiaceae bacterium]|nr:AI-2E family transporter [Polyangiaceae bacterium]